MVIPVIQALKRDSRFDVTVLGLTTARVALDRAAIPSLGFKDLLRETDHEAREWGNRLSEKISHHDVGHEESVAYLGLSYWDLVQRWGTQEAARQYEKFQRQSFLPIGVMERFFRELQPDLVVATNSPRAERAAIEAAGNLGIPSVCMVDLLALHEIAYIGREGYASRVCVLSDYVKNLFVKAGRNKEEIVVTGNPAFDRLFSVGVEKEAAQLRQSKGWGQDKVILWASNVEPPRHPFTGQPGDPSLPNRVEEQLLRLTRLHPEWRLIVRPHPGEAMRMNDLPDKVSLSMPQENLPVILHAIDCVVTMASTVGLEAFLLGKPLVSVDLSVFTPDLPFTAMGMSRGVSSIEALGGAVTQVLSGSWKAPASIPEIGRASESVVKLIKSLLGD